MQDVFCFDVAVPQRRFAARQERELSAVVNAAYGLTPEDEVLIWCTVPPRMPIARPVLSAATEDAPP
jgi:hypothetical protein